MPSLREKLNAIAPEIQNESTPLETPGPETAPAGDLRSKLKAIAPEVTPTPEPTPTPAPSASDDRFSLDFPSLGEVWERTKSAPLGVGAAAQVLESPKYAPDLLNKIGEVTEKYSGAPSRAAVRALQQGEPKKAIHDFAEAFGHPEKAPTPDEILTAAGIKPNKATRFMAEVLLDWSNFVPYGALSEQLGKLPKLKKFVDRRKVVTGPVVEALKEAGTEGLQKTAFVLTGGESGKEALETYAKLKPGSLSAPVDVTRELTQADVLKGGGIFKGGEKLKGEVGRAYGAIRDELYQQGLAREKFIETVIAKREPKVARILDRISLREDRIAALYEKGYANKAENLIAENVADKEVLEGIVSQFRGIPSIDLPKASPIMDAISSREKAISRLMENAGENSSKVAELEARNAADLARLDELTQAIEVPARLGGDSLKVAVTPSIERNANLLNSMLQDLPEARTAIRGWNQRLAEMLAKGEADSYNLVKALDDLDDIEYTAKGVFRSIPDRVRGPMSAVRRDLFDMLKEADPQFFQMRRNYHYLAKMFPEQSKGNWTALVKYGFQGAKFGTAASTLGPLGVPLALMASSPRTYHAAMSMAQATGAGVGMFKAAIAEGAGSAAKWAAANPEDAAKIAQAVRFAAKADYELSAEEGTGIPEGRLPPNMVEPYVERILSYVGMSDEEKAQAISAARETGDILYPEVFSQ